MRPVLLYVGSAATPALAEAALRAAENGWAGLDAQWTARFDVGSFPVQELALPVRSVSYGCESLAVEAEAGRVAPLLHAGAEAGACCFNVRVPGVYQPAEGGAVSFQRYQDAFNFTYQLLRSLRLESEVAGVSLALEAPSERFLQSPVEVRELIDAVHSAAVGVCLHWDRVADWARADWVATLGQRIQSVRVSGSDSLRAAQATLERMPPDRPLIVGVPPNPFVSAASVVNEPHA